MLLSVAWLILMYHLIVKRCGTNPLNHPVAPPEVGSLHSAAVASGGAVQGSALLPELAPHRQENLSKESKIN